MIIFRAQFEGCGSLGVLELYNIFVGVGIHYRVCIFLLSERVLFNYEFTRNNCGFFMFYVFRACDFGAIKPLKRTTTMKVYSANSCLVKIYLPSRDSFSPKRNLMSVSGLKY